MSLEGVEKNLNKIRELSIQYDRLLIEEKELEKKIEGLRGGYDEGKIGRDIFSEYNKKLTEVKSDIMRIRGKVRIFCGNINKEVDEEIKNVK